MIPSNYTNAEFIKEFCIKYRDFIDNLELSRLENLIKKHDEAIEQEKVDSETISNEFDLLQESEDNAITLIDEIINVTYEAGNKKYICKKIQELFENSDVEA